MAKAKFKPVSASKAVADIKSGTRLNNLSIKIGIVGACLSIIAGLFDLFLNPSVTNNKDSHDITNITEPKNDKEKKIYPADSNAGKINHLVTTPTVPHFAKKDFLGISMSGEQWNNNLSKKITDLFTAMGYDPKEADPGTAYNFDNLIRGNLSLNGPEKEKGALNTVTTEYSLVLTLQFFNGMAKSPCSQRSYIQEVPASQSDDKEGIIRQGVTGLIAQLKNETSFPLCIAKK